VKRAAIETVILTHPERDHVSDIALVGENGKIVVFDCKAHSMESHIAPGWLRRAKSGSGKSALFVEGKAEQVLFYALAANSVIMDVGIDFPPLISEPPKLAECLISLIPVKHREDLAGDLEEDYWNRFVPRHGARVARRLYWLHAVYAFLGFLARPLAGIAGLGFIRKLVEILMHRMTK